MCWALLLQEAHAMQAIRHSMHSRHFAPQNKEGNPLLLHGQSHFAPQNKEENPLLLQRQSHFAPQNKEDWL